VAAGDPPFAVDLDLVLVDVAVAVEYAVLGLDEVVVSQVLLAVPCPVIVISGRYIRWQVPLGG
jgi:hypothetical protein